MEGSSSTSCLMMAFGGDNNNGALGGPTGPMMMMMPPQMTSSSHLNAESNALFLPLPHAHTHSTNSNNHQDHHLNNRQAAASSASSMMQLDDDDNTTTTNPHHQHHNLSSSTSAGGGGYFMDHNNNDIGGSSSSSPFSSVKAKIVAHPHYHRLLAAYINCQKIGAPPEVVARLEEVCASAATLGRNNTSYIGEDPALDQFMEAYCEMLTKYEQELSKPFKEAMLFLSRIECQFKALTLASDSGDDP